MPLPRSTPADVGVDPRAIADFVHACLEGGVELHSVMVLRHGRVIAEGWAEPYRPAHRQLVYSLSKTFASAAVGITVADGALGYDEPLVDIFPDLVDERVGPKARTIRLRDVLSMASGHTSDLISLVDGQRTNLTREHVGAFLRHEPEGVVGETFAYNQPCTWSAVRAVHERTGVDVHELLRERVFPSLGIEGTTWARDADGRSLGFTGLHLTTEHIASFFQLLLDDGVRDGVRLLPAEWIERHRQPQVSTAPASAVEPGALGTRVDDLPPAHGAADGDASLDEATSGDEGSVDETPADDWARGYGWQVWMNRHGYRGDGAFGQFGLVLPAHDMVVVTTSATELLHVVLESAWTHLLPGVDRLPGSGPGPDTPAEGGNPAVGDTRDGVAVGTGDDARVAMDAALASMALAPAGGWSAGAVAADRSGWVGPGMGQPGWGQAGRDQPEPHQSSTHQPGRDQTGRDQRGPRQASPHQPGGAAVGTEPDRPGEPAWSGIDQWGGHLHLTSTDDGWDCTWGLGADTTHTFPVGAGRWRETRLADGGLSLRVAASATATSDGHVLELVVLNTPHRATLRLPAGGTEAEFTWALPPLAVQRPWALAQVFDDADADDADA